MIKRIDFSDIKTSPIGYLGNIDFFNKNKSVTFKSGINVIVGLNGCGKTTLLNLIRRYTLCLTNMTSTCPSNNLEFINLLFSNDNKLLNGVKIISDYQGVVFNMLDYKVLERESNCLQSVSKFNTYVNTLNCSTGEGISSGLDSLFNIMFDPKTNLEFPIKKLKEVASNKYSAIHSKAEQLLQYSNRYRSFDEGIQQAFHESLEIFENAFDYQASFEKISQALEVAEPGVTNRFVSSYEKTRETIRF